MAPDPDLTDLVRGFLDEVADRLRALDDDLRALDDPADPAQRLDSVFRALHSVKGSAACLSLTDLAEAAHRAESILAPWRSAQATPDPEARARLIRAVEEIHALRDDLAHTTPPALPREHGAHHFLIDLLSNASRLAEARAHEAGRRVSLRIEAPANITIDRDETGSIATALLHTLNNCIDHAAEPPSQRRREGKPDATHITIHAALPDEKHLTVAVSDDGPGLDRDAILRKARSLGLAAADPLAMSEQQILDLVLRPGLSTADSPTLNAGRGVGLDASNRALAELGGSLEVLSTPGQGTTITFRIPLLNRPSPSADTGSESASAA